MSIERILTDPIPENKAIEFVAKFKIEEANNGNYKIPTAWLFEKGIIESFEIPNVTGLSFYLAIDNEKQPDQDGKYTLTLVMVPAIINNKGVLKDLTDETMYEFSQFCPTICSVNVKGDFIIKDATFTVPTSFYIPKNFIEQLFVDHPTSKGIRLYRHIIDNKLELSIVPVADAPPNYNDLIPPAYYPNIVGICEASNQTFCDLTSILYKA